MYFNLSEIELQRIPLAEENLLELDFTEEVEVPEEEKKELEEPKIDPANKSLANLMQDIENIKKGKPTNKEKTLEQTLMEKIALENEQTIEELRKNGKAGFDPSKYETKNKENEPQQNEKNKVDEGNNFAGKVTVVCSIPGRECYTKKPTYICKGGGKVYVEIKVDRIGRVRNAEVNSSKSTTTNQCILDNALQYAKETTQASSGEGMAKGFIIYNFIGQ